ncbi:hypothetical protein [Paracoccus versutus]|uniref:hypothetical protein n=1 Tax=Paracoccus versutus TaxID=34007 RepID=UPI0015F07EA1|nr:hypothetical protein [Paracoccus versutus]
MRISETLSPQLDDLATDGLIIWQTKFHKSRLRPLHATTWDTFATFVCLESKAR